MDYGWIDFWGPSVECLAISPADPKRLAFGTSGHLFLSDDGGDSWHQAYCITYPDGRFKGNGLEVTCLNSIVPDPVRRNRLYLCYFDIGLLISDDGGLSFRRSYKGMKGEGNCFTVVVDPKSPETIWAGTGQWAWNEGYLCRSKDGGESWEVVGSGLPNGQIKQIVLDLKSPVGKRRLLATVNGYGFYESTDGGENWHSINGDLPEDAVKEPRGILLDPKNEKHIIVACGGSPKFAGVYETKDGGKSWRILNEERIFANIQAITADPKDLSKLYLAVREYYEQAEQRMYPGGLFKSVDGGRRWERILDYHFVSSVIVSPANSEIIYATTTDHPYHDDCVAEGVLKSSDGGKTWRKVNEGLSHLNISCISIDPFDPSRLYVGTGGNGAFVGIDSAVIPTTMQKPKKQAQVRYPNKNIRPSPSLIPPKPKGANKMGRLNRRYATPFYRYPQPAPRRYPTPPFSHRPQRFLRKYLLYGQRHRLKLHPHPQKDFFNPKEGVIK
jgi:photosystem II stability/assembly factor-like uncharacterized protein